MRVGEWDVRNDYEPRYHENIDVQKVIIHERFNPRNLQNDIALLILKVNNNYSTVYST